MLKLSARCKHELQDILSHSSDGILVRRAQMLLWLSEGVSNINVAKRMNRTRQSVYELVWRFEERKELSIFERLSDESGRGRKPTLKIQVKWHLSRLLMQNPETLGYRTTCWTVPMMRTQLDKLMDSSISPDTIRSALKDLRYSYKRPRFVLSRQSKTWRKAKGGFVEA